MPRSISVVFTSRSLNRNVGVFAETNPWCEPHALRTNEPDAFTFMFSRMHALTYELMLNFMLNLVAEKRETDPGKEPRP